ncbi:hypothetical protein INT45_004651 [Circinella minor]|uniref:Cyclic nucleotide-binding domain-containing protein n=1 Tax=Circinella minor TaxID=1195481 RepID=A0A8H7RXQ0_9FUNG|nr:hypothetical protein INT45_004651 [Circinella minor]
MTTKHTHHAIDSFSDEVFESKSKHQEGIIRCATFDNFIFSRLNSQQYQRLLQAMKSNVQIPMGLVIVQQGSYADKFYIVESGIVEHQINDAAECHLQIGASFGALSLLHDVQWPATYVAATDVVLTELSRSAYQAIMIEQSIFTRQFHKQLINNISLFNKLETIDQYRILDALILVEYQDGQVVYHQNELTDKKIFIIKDGNVVGFNDKKNNYRTITKMMGQGDYFGNADLLKDQEDTIATTTFIAYGSLTCLTLKEDTLYGF